jgi:hypothetical protein
MTEQVKTSSQEPNIVVINKVHAETGLGCVGVVGLARALCECASLTRPQRTLSITCATEDERFLHLLELVKAMSHIIIKGGG